jgi:hypothetical protein
MISVRCPGIERQRKLTEKWSGDKIIRTEKPGKKLKASDQQRTNSPAG